MPRIVVELTDEVVSRLVERAEDGAPDYTKLEDAARELGLRSLLSLLAEFGDPPSVPLMPNKSILSQIGSRRAVRRPARREGDGRQSAPPETEGLAGFFAVDVGNLEASDQQRLLSSLQALHDVKSAAFEPKYRGARAATHGAPNLRRYQTYLKALGVAEVEALSQHDVHGKLEWYGVGFADLDVGWNFKHESLKHLAKPPVFPVGFGLEKTVFGSDGSDFAHGTSVLGICVGGARIQGIAKGAAVKALLYPTTEQSTAATILGFIDDQHLDSLGFGDILLIEIEQDAGTRTTEGLPLEVQPANMRAIQIAVSQGIVVIEVAGNGRIPDTIRLGWDLDEIAQDSQQAPAWATEDGGTPIDSGAILVSGCELEDPVVEPPAKYDADPACNFGTRIDCYGWSAYVTTPGLDHPPTLGRLPSLKHGDENSYDFNFNGTSAASAMVAGAALVIQRMAHEELGYALSPAQLRAVLREAGSGVPVNCAGKPTRIFPHLPSIRQLLVNLPKLMIRAFDGDDGANRMAEATVNSQSPDISLCAAPCNDPQNQHDRVVAGQTAYVYVGVRNFGDAPAEKVRAIAYWSIHEANAHTRVVWEELEESGGHTVAAGNIVKVIGPIEIPLPAAQGAGTKVDILVAAGGDLDPRPLIPPARRAKIGWSRTELLPFLQSNLCVGIRTFDLV